MEYYQIRHKISFVKCECPGSDNPEMLNDGNFGITISERDVADISRCEQALMNTGFQAMREAMSEYFSAISEEKVLIYFLMEGSKNLFLLAIVNLINNNA